MSSQATDTSVRASITVEAPISAFLPDGESEMVDAIVRDWPLRYGAYPVEGLRVWGATARIVQSLLERLAPILRA